MITLKTHNRKLSVSPSLKQTSWNIGALWSHKIASALASIVVTGVATRFYGLDQMGIWVLATTVASYMQLLDFGTSSALPRILPRLLASGAGGDVQKFVSTAFTSTVFVAVIGLLFLPTFSHLLVTLFSISQAGQSIAQIIFGLAILSSILGLPFRIGYGLLASKHRFDIYFGLDLAAVLLRTVVAIATVAIAQAGIVFFAIAVLLPPIIINFIQYRAGLRLNAMKTNWRGFSVAALKELLSHSGASFVLTFSAMLSTQGSIMAAGLVSATSVAKFSFPLLLVTQAMSFGASAGALVAPVASALGAARDRTHLRNVTVNAILTSSSVGVLTVLLLLLTGPLLLKHWLSGPTVNEVSLQVMAELLTIIAFGSLGVAPAAAVRGVLMGVGKHWETAITELTCSVLGIAVGLLMMNVECLGLNGLAYGLSFAFVSRYIGLLWLATKEIDLTFGALLVQSAKPFCVGLLGLGAAIFAFEMPTIDTGLVSVLLSNSVAVIVWILGTWLWVLDTAKRRFVELRVQKVLTKWI